MDIVIRLTLTHLDELHASVYQFLGRGAGITAPVAAQLAQPFHPHDGVFWHHLQAKFAAVQW